MKNFVSNNWYRIAIAFSSFIISFSFLIYALKNNTVQASPHFKEEIVDKTKFDQVVALPDGKIYGVYYDATFHEWKTELLTQLQVDRSK